MTASLHRMTHREPRPEERRRKEVQLELNLTRALTKIAENAGHELRLTPCDQPAPTTNHSRLDDDRTFTFAGRAWSA